MNEEDVEVVREDFRIFITKDTFTRDDFKAARAKLELAGLSKTGCRAILALISMVRTELREASLKAKEACFDECMERAIVMMSAAKAGDVTVKVDASSRSSAEARSQSELIGEQTMGDKIDIGGDVTNAAVGSGASFRARDVSAYKLAVDGSTIDGDLKSVLQRARETLETAQLPEGDAEDARDDLGKLTSELDKPQKDIGRIQKILDRLKSIAEPVAAIITSAASFAKIISAGG